MAYANLEGLGWLAEDMQAWTAAHYEPKLVFDQTPVYSVTLAEDTDISQASPYVIDTAALGGTYSELWISMILPSALSVNCVCSFQAGTDDRLLGFLGTGSTHSACFSARNCGARFSLGWRANGASVSKSVSSLQINPSFFNNEYSQIMFWPTAAATLPTGTEITVYGAQEV